MSSLSLQHPEWSDGDYDVLAHGVAAGRIMRAATSLRQHNDRTVHTQRAVAVERVVAASRCCPA